MSNLYKYLKRWVNLPERQLLRLTASNTFEFGVWIYFTKSQLAGTWRKIKICRFWFIFPLKVSVKVEDRLGVEEWVPNFMKLWWGWSKNCRTHSNKFWLNKVFGDLRFCMLKQIICFKWSRIIEGCRIY